jgi:MFS family permease
MTDAVAPATGAAAPGPVPLVSDGYRRYALTLLLVIYTLNFLDRQVVNILAESIKKDLGLHDWQLGMMTGLAFALFYTVLGLPIARLAERANRAWIISGAIAAWSGFTLLCGLAQSFPQLILARIGVGVGEAGCTPPSHSLITDYVPKDKRASAIAFYSIGTPLGSLLGMAMGGVVADAWGWRAAFLVAGAPGIVMALLAFLTLKEPRKATIKGAPHAGPGLGEALSEILGKKTFWLMAIGAAIIAFAGYGSAAFIGSFYFRNHAAEAAAAAQGLGLGVAGFLGLALGIIGGVAGILGSFMGGVIGDRLGKSGPQGQMTLPAVAAVIGAPFYIYGMTSPSMVTAMAVLAIPTFLNSMWYGPVYGSVQGLVRPQTRATAAAVILFIINLIGLGFGPLAVGALSDVYADALGMGAGEGIRWALMTSASSMLIAAVLFWIARKTIKADMVS